MQHLCTEPYLISSFGRNRVEKDKIKPRSNSIDGQCRMMINGIQFIQVLLEANGLAAGKDHQFKGRYDAEKNAVIISLEKDEQSALSPQKCTT